MYRGQQVEEFCYCAALSSERMHTDNPGHSLRSLRRSGPPVGARHLMSIYGNSSIPGISIGTTPTTTTLPFAK